MSRSLRSGFRHRAGRAVAVVGLVATIAFVSAPAVASAAPNPLAGSTFSISSPGSLSGTSGQPITPVQFVASNVDVSTAPATTSIRWVPEQLPKGLTLSGTGLLSGTLKAAIPRGVYDLQVKAIETVTTELNGKQRIDRRRVRFDTSISISGPSVTSSDQTAIGSGFSEPSGVAVDSSGHVFVSDANNGRVVKMNSDGSNLITIASGLQFPYGLTVDSSVHVFVAESNNHRVVKMDADGSNQTEIVSGSAPAGVAVDSSGTVFVSDLGNTKIIVVPSNASFNIPDQILPQAFAGSTLSPTQLVVDKVDPSTSPRVTSVRWSASSLPAGLWLSSSGELRGVPRASLQGGYYPIYVTATESVKTKIGGAPTVTTTKTVSRKLSLYVYKFGF